MSNGKQVEFPAPEGFKIPEGLADDESFDALGTFRLKKSGMICLVEIDGAPLNGYDDKDNAKEDYSESVGSRYDAMTQGGS